MTDSEDVIRKMIEASGLKKCQDLNFATGEQPILWVTNREPNSPQLVFLPGLWRLHTPIEAEEALTVNLRCLRISDFGQNFSFYYRSGNEGGYLQEFSDIKMSMIVPPLAIRRLFPPPTEPMPPNVNDGTMTKKKVAVPLYAYKPAPVGYCTHTSRTDAVEMDSSCFAHAFVATAFDESVAIFRASQSLEHSASAFGMREVLPAVTQSLFLGTCLKKRSGEMRKEQNPNRGSSLQFETALRPVIDAVSSAQVAALTVDEQSRWSKALQTVLIVENTLRTRITAAVQEGVALLGDPGWWSTDLAKFATFVASNLHFVLSTDVLSKLDSLAGSVGAVVGGGSPSKETNKNFAAPAVIAAIRTAKTNIVHVTVSDLVAQMVTTVAAVQCRVTLVLPISSYSSRLREVQLKWRRARSLWNSRHESDFYPSNSTQDEMMLNSFRLISEMEGILSLSLTLPDAPSEAHLTRISTRLNFATQSQLPWLWESTDEAMKREKQGATDLLPAGAPFNDTEATVGEISRILAELLPVCTDFSKSMSLCLTIHKKAMDSARRIAAASAVATARAVALEIMSIAVTAKSKHANPFHSPLRQREHHETSNLELAVTGEVQPILSDSTIDHTLAVFGPSQTDALCHAVEAARSKAEAALQENEEQRSKITFANVQAIHNIELFSKEATQLRRLVMDVSRCFRHFGYKESQSSRTPRCTKEAWFESAVQGISKRTMWLGLAFNALQFGEAAHRCWHRLLSDVNPIASVHLATVTHQRIPAPAFLEELPFDVESQPWKDFCAKVQDSIADAFFLDRSSVTINGPAQVVSKFQEILTPPHICENTFPQIPAIEPDNDHLEGRNALLVASSVLHRISKLTELSDSQGHPHTMFLLNTAVVAPSIGETVLSLKDVAALIESVSDMDWGKYLERCRAALVAALVHPDSQNNYRVVPLGNNQFLFIRRPKKELPLSSHEELQAKETGKPTTSIVIPLGPKSKKLVAEHFSQGSVVNHTKLLGELISDVAVSLEVLPSGPPNLTLNDYLQLPTEISWLQNDAVGGCAWSVYKECREFLTSSPKYIELKYLNTDKSVPLSAVVCDCHMVE